MPRNRARVLRLADAAPAAPVTPPAKGRLFYDFQIPDAFFGGLPQSTAKVRWIREHLPHETRILIGRHSAWYEADILAYIASLQGAPHPQAVGQ